MSKSVLESFEKWVEGGIAIKCADHIFARVDLPRLDTMAEVLYEQFVEACKSKREASLKERGTPLRKAAGKSTARWHKWCTLRLKKRGSENNDETFACETN